MNRAERRIVADTNVIVSALLRGRKTGLILNDIAEGNAVPCYSWGIIQEYLDVLMRPEFGFEETHVQEFIDLIQEMGMSVIPPVSEIEMTDEADRIFYDTAKYCRADLVTGNKKHFPKEDWIISPAEYLMRAPV